MDPPPENAPTVERIADAGTDRTQVWESSLAKNHTDKNGNKVGAKVRAWESAGAGNVLELEGPDAQAVTMPPAPRFDGPELTAEVAEVYAMALLRMSVEVPEDYQPPEVDPRGPLAPDGELSRCIDTNRDPLSDPGF